ncbi:hypothetical protein MMC20_002409 [Loxospora ochrophaea]|nr:hypothetical protein [Loxospora ochrophaea]
MSNNQNTHHPQVHPPSRTKEPTPREYSFGFPDSFSDYPSTDQLYPWQGHTAAGAIAQPSEDGANNFAVSTAAALGEPEWIRYIDFSPLASQDIGNTSEESPNKFHADKDQKSQQVPHSITRSSQKSTLRQRSRRNRDPAPTSASDAATSRKHMKRKKRDDLNKGVDGISLSSYPRKIRKTQREQREVQSLSATAELACQLKLSSNSNQFPNDQEIVGLGLAFNTPYDNVLKWFEDRFKDSRKRRSRNASGSNHRSSITKSYQDNQQKCLPVTDAASASLNRDERYPFACTSRCGKKFKKKDDWRKHEELNYPQEIWRCHLDSCRSGLKEKQIYRRKDKFKEHLAKCHGYSCVADKDIERYHFQIKSKFSRLCIFQDCETHFHSWRERIDHIGKHFVRRWDITQWRSTVNNNVIEEETDLESSGANSEREEETEWEEDEDNSTIRSFSDSTSDISDGSGLSNDPDNNFGTEGPRFSGSAADNYPSSNDKQTQNRGQNTSGHRHGIDPKSYNYPLGHTAQSNPIDPNSKANVVDFSRQFSSKLTITTKTHKSCPSASTDLDDDKALSVTPNYQPGSDRPAQIQTWLSSNTDSQIVKVIAERSNLFALESWRIQNHTQSSKDKEGTSLLMSGNDSLTALTRSTGISSAASTITSIQSSIGVRALGAARMLEAGEDGALEIPFSHRPSNLVCPFNFLSCILQFSDYEEWLQHSMSHFGQAGPPRQSQCCFCDAKFHSEDRIECWKSRMEHVAVHLKLDYKPKASQPDFELYDYLWVKRLITPTQFKELKEGKILHSGLDGRIHRQEDSGPQYQIPSKTRRPRDQMQSNRRPIITYGSIPPPIAERSLVQVQETNSVFSHKERHSTTRWS